MKCRGRKTALGTVLITLQFAAMVGVLSAQEPNKVNSGVAERGVRGQQQLSGHITRAMVSARMIGRVPPTTTMTLVIGLPVRNPDDLKAAANEVSDPASSSYRHYLTATEFASKFGAAPADYQKVLEWARMRNLAFTTHPNRLVVEVAGSVANIEAALHVHLNYYLRSDESRFYAPDQEPSLDLPIPVGHIGNLDNYIVRQHAGGSGSGDSRRGADFRHAYASCTDLTGSGQTVGIKTGDMFSQSDITTYFTNMKLAAPMNVQTIPEKTAATGTAAESTLDIEMILSIAPGAQVVAFTDGGGDDDVLAHMAERTDIKQFSTSYTMNVSSTGEYLLAELALQGQSFFMFTGDQGAYYYTSNPDPTRAGKYIVNGPQETSDVREQPYVTLVGGTGLDMIDHGATYGTETTWPGSSGGILSNNVPGGIGVKMPPYQAGFATVSNQGSSVYRNAPDVSAEATDVEIFFSGSAKTFAGTSASTPLWAGFMALVNQSSAVRNMPSVGFANPLLYALARTSAYNDGFNDITTGSNPAYNGTMLSAVYSAVSGYDLATGLGSPKCHLIDLLATGQFKGARCNVPAQTQCLGSERVRYSDAEKACGPPSPPKGPIDVWRTCMDYEAMVDRMAIGHCDAQLCGPNLKCIALGSRVPSGSPVLGICCAANEDRCEGGCADLKYDRNNCGSCGNKCNPGNPCFDGRCLIPMRIH